MRRTISTTLLPLALLAAPTAQASYDPIGAGTAKLVLEKSLVSFLEANGLELSAKSGVKRQGRKLTLPVIAGNFDLTLGQGEIEAQGSLLIQGDRGAVLLRQIRARNKHDALIAKVGGSQLKVATAKKRTAKRTGFGATLSATSLRLTANVATRLSKKLRPSSSFKAGQLLGSLTATKQPTLSTILPEGRASISVDLAFAAKMDSLFVSINPIFPTEHPSAFTFPIAVGGSLAPDGSQGTLRTAGALELLQLGAGQVFQEELWLDMGVRSDSAEFDVEPTPDFPGKLGRVGAYDLGPSAQISSDPKTRTISVSGPLMLTEATARIFDEAFAEGRPTFSAGETMGTLGFAAVGQ